MSTNDDHSTTIRETTPVRHERAKTPVLLVGSFVPQTSRVVSVGRGVTIGRGRTPDARAGSQDTDVILHSDGALSRPHLRIAADREGWTVEDLASTNGTFVDGRRVKKPTPLSDGSIVQFGNHAGVFRRLSSAELAAVEQEAAEPLGPVATLSPVLAVTAVGLRRLASTDASLLFVGETGVGKEITARAVHAASGRSGPFVAINCAALPETLIESELFGHEKGSFTGATERRAGCFELAQGGTLLLDEIGEMPMATQAKLLRILEDSKVRRLGGKAEFEVDVRLVAATNKVPDEAVRGGHLREDLFYRLNVFQVHLPPLRDRKDDIRSIAETLIRDLNHKHECRVTEIADSVLEALQRHEWPGNVRELRNVLERAVILAGEGTIESKHLPAFLQTITPGAPDVAAPVAAAPSRNGMDWVSFSIGTTVEEAEKGLIIRTLEHTRNNKTRAAEILGISLKTLHNKLKEYSGVAKEMEPPIT